MFGVAMRCVMDHVRSGQTACQQPFTQLKAYNIQPVHTSVPPTKTVKPCPSSRVYSCPHSERSS